MHELPTPAPGQEIRVLDLEEPCGCIRVPLGDEDASLASSSPSHPSEGAGDQMTQIRAYFLQVLDVCPVASETCTAVLFTLVLILCRVCYVPLCTLTPYFRRLKVIML